MKDNNLEGTLVWLFMILMGLVAIFDGEKGAFYTLLGLSIPLGVVITIIGRRD